MKLNIAYLVSFAQAAPLAANLRRTYEDTSIEPIFSLPDDPSWFENLAYRASANTIITTRLDVPQIWSVDPTTREGTLLADVPEAVGFVGITQLTSTAPETFIAASANFSVATGVQANSSVLWKLTFADDGSATVEEAAPVPQMGLINGITKWDNDTVLAADSTLGIIWKVELSTGEASVALEDPTMAPTSDIGVNGVHVYTPQGSDEVYVYYSSTDQGLLARVPVSSTTAQSTADVEIIASGFSSLDDFTILSDGSVYLATGKSNTIVHVELDGNVEVVAGSLASLDLASSTSCVLGTDGTLYVSTAGGEEAPVNGTLTEPGSIVEVDLGTVSRL